METQAVNLQLIESLIQAIRSLSSAEQFILDQKLYSNPLEPFSLGQTQVPSYDPEADVLYIDFYNPPRSSDDSELTDDNVVIRYNEQEEIVGLTIMNASQRSVRV